jgi:predicted transposase/invertase (TIGR01784 family)
VAGVVQEGHLKARNDGLADGKAQGREEGREEGKAQLLKSMHASGMTVVQICQVTHLSADEVERSLGS